MSASSSRSSNLLQRLRNSLPAAVIQRFLQAGVPDLAAALAFYTLLSLAPLLVLLLWLTASLYPPAQASLVAQIGDLAGPAAAEVARTVLANAQAQPDIGSLAGGMSTGGLLFGGPPGVSPPWCLPSCRAH